MLVAFARGTKEAFAPEQRRALLRSMGLAVLLLAILWAGATMLIARAHVGGIGWLSGVVDVLGGVAALFVAWTLFPAMTFLTFGFFAERVIAALEREHYPDLPPPRRIGIGESCASVLRLAALGLVLNLVALPLYLVPGANFVLYYAVNGYLVGRMYFETIALRRMESGRMHMLWQWRRGTFIAAGAILAFLLTLPLIDLAAPLIGLAFMLHLVEEARRDAPARINPGAP
jgi:CysZ protein